MVQVVPLILKKPLLYVFGASFTEHVLQYPGDLKLVEKPSPLTLAPHDFANIKANVKVASTENGIIFGNIGLWTV